MRVVLDACVLYPPVLREILLGAASAGLYDPLWSERILEEWARATRKLEALTGTPGAGAPAWLLSHPKTAERIAAIEARESRWNQPA